MIILFIFFFLSPFPSSHHSTQALAVLEQHVPLAIKLAQRESAIGSVRLAKFMYESLGNKARAAQMEVLANELER